MYVCHGKGDTKITNAIDLFCGAGGASLGIESAGFDLIAAIDTDTDALDTHADNLSGYTVNHDLSSVDTSIVPDRDIDYIHGSPPCQGFSVAKGDRDVDDERNSLVFDFIDWVAEINPQVVSMENVTGMLSISSHFMDKVISAFRDAGYTVKYRTLNAADYGVPQTRKRVFTVAIHNDVDTTKRWFPKPTHSKTATTTLDGRELNEWLTVEEAISDLIDITDGCTEQNKIRKEGYDGRNGPIWYPLNQPSQTITASDRMKVVTENTRRLTVRECARLQSFPDDFVFNGSKTSQYQQVGNAVPPLLQRHVAVQLLEIIRS
ncbi:DNA methyltransferase [Haloquadratum phage sp.]|nr:DNA methyltransferase [Haloquadratum phage sp.]